VQARRAALSIFDHELKNSASVLTNAVGCNVVDVACCLYSVHFESSRPVTNRSTLSGDGVSFGGGDVVVVVVVATLADVDGGALLATEGFDPVTGFDDADAACKCFASDALC
jgi:hypothetical protein